LFVEQRDGGRKGRGEKVVARMAFVMDITVPDDIMAFSELAFRLPARPARGAEVDAWSLTCLFVAHATKWPVAVRYLSQHQGFRLRPQSAQSAVSQISTALRDAVCFMEGKQLHHVHANMSKCGRMHATTGLIIFAMGLGLLSKTEQGVKLRLGVHSLA
jgi:hypothetical protein